MFKHFPFIHNHGDFVHLDALREWLRGVPSLDTFLKYKNDKAIVKDMHFTDEKTTVEYIDTTDDTKKESTLCEYLTSSVFGPKSDHDNIKYNKIDHVRFNIDKHNERWIDVREKENGNMRNNVFQSNVPIAYEATDDFSTSNHTSHLGINEYGVNVYSDDTLRKTKGYSFAKPAAYNVDDDNYDSAPKAYYFGFNQNGVKIFNSTTKEVVQRYQYKDTLSVQEIELTDCNPFSSITGRNVDNDVGELGLTKSENFHGLKIGDTIVSGQAMYTITGDLQIKAGQFVELMLTPGSMGTSKFARNVYPKTVQCLNNQGLITSVMKNSSYPLDNSTPTYVTIYNPTTQDVTVQYLHFTF